MEKLNEIVMKNWLEIPDVNCAQSTACPLLEYHGYPDISKTLYQVYRVYGGGLSWRLACGTITGSIGALSFLAAQKDLPKSDIEVLVKEFLYQMQEKFGELEL